MTSCYKNTIYFSNFFQIIDWLFQGALFQSPHADENDVQTISHKCEVIPLADYTKRLGKEPSRYASIYDNNDIYYLAGHYDPTAGVLTMEPGIIWSS